MCDICVCDVFVYDIYICDVCDTCVYVMFMYVMCVCEMHVCVCDMYVCLCRCVHVRMNGHSSQRNQIPRSWSCRSFWCWHQTPVLCKNGKCS